MPHEITEVLPQSIAQELEITAGDVLLQINGKKIKDVFDYQFATQAEELLLEIQKPCGEIWELEIEKDADEDLGIVFKRPLMAAKRRCVNKCIFCFVEQQPSGLRSSLYFKDDDIRLSFLHGNYVTLTNLSEAEIRRFASYHLSPLRISVHAADLELRKKMMGSENAANLFTALNIFAEAGIKMHFQVVVCKGVNDGEHLAHTISVLAEQKGAESLAIVPAGLTRHRDGLHSLSQFTPEEARNVISQVNFKNCNKTFVFAADEWYIMARIPLPQYNSYGDFPQLDNGVGMLRLFEHDFLHALGKLAGTVSGGFGLSGRVEGCACVDVCAPKPPLFPNSCHGKIHHVGIVTGLSAAAFMRGLADTFQSAHPDIKITVYPIKNNFFGENITVSGLLTGVDIINQLQNQVLADVLFLPENAFRANTEIMLDGTTLTQLSAVLNRPVKVGSADGGVFFNQIKDLGGKA
ncbi:MAG: DUF512 domain-containing protein [Defluviitaleaceae bacterium]|nr:DUF512 domain-containing protein [Defluviitaleaceae bacterium]MCL2264273.1 DUF512 domain-containing protein [Defluviitaleaceae bacterium]